MGEFIINTPYHKRWWLPDRRHYYNSVLFGDEFHITIWRSNERFGAVDHVVVRHTIKIDPGGKWKELCELSQELANKRFKDDRIRKDKVR